MFFFTVVNSSQEQELLIVENTNSICRPEVVGLLRFQATKKIKEFPCDTKVCYKVREH